MKKFSLVLLLGLLVGCANGVPSIDTSIAPEGVTETVEKTFIGIPPLLSMEGSKVRLDQEWVLTVKHNSPILNTLGEEVYYHPTCDIALIRDMDKEAKGNTLGYLYKGDTVFLIGYPLGFPLSVNSGTYIDDFLMSGDTCNYSGITGTVMGGMSGGAGFDNKGNLVGIVVGFSKVTLNGEYYPSIGTIVPLAGVSAWLTEVTGNVYF
jgi:hypothetical protein